MEESLIDMLYADMTLVGISLLDHQQVRDTFANDIRADITTEELGIGSPVPSIDALSPMQTRVEVPRDRISITQTREPRRTIIRRDYPTRLSWKEDIGRLADVAVKAIRHSKTQIRDQQLRAHGYNLACTFDIEPTSTAVQYIADHLFSKTFDIGFIGGSARLLFNHPDGSRSTFMIQPRPDNDVSSRVLYISLNVHHQGGRMPSPDQIRESLSSLKSQTIGFMEKLNSEV